MIDTYHFWPFSKNYKMRSINDRNIPFFAFLSKTFSPLPLPIRLFPSISLLYLSSLSLPSVSPLPFSLCLSSLFLPFAFPLFLPLYHSIFGLFFISPLSLPFSSLLLYLFYFYELSLFSLPFCLSQCTWHNDYNINHNYRSYRSTS